MIGTLLFLAMALLVVAAGLRALRRSRDAKRDDGLSDEAIRRIEREGTVRYEPPEELDLEEIRREEDAFWERTWDEPEEL